MSGFTPQTLAALESLAATNFSAQPGITPANTDEGSSLGPIFEAAALLALFIQNENLYLEQILRMATIPNSPDPSPDLDSFVNPFAIMRLPAVAATGTVACATPSAVTQQIVIPSGAIVASPSGIQFQIQPNGTGYSASLGGYPINTGQSSVSVPVTCLTAGIIGNVAANTIFAPVGGPGTPIPPGVNSITNAAAFTNGVNLESNAALK